MFVDLLTCYENYEICTGLGAHHVHAAVDVALLLLFSIVSGIGTRKYKIADRYVQLLRMKICCDRMYT